jgi:hypothetical protein
MAITSPRWRHSNQRSDNVRRLASGIAPATTIRVHAPGSAPSAASHAPFGRQVVRRSRSGRNPAAETPLLTTRPQTGIAALTHAVDVGRPTSTSLPAAVGSLGARTGSMLPAGLVDRAQSRLRDSRPLRVRHVIQHGIEPLGGSKQRGPAPPTVAAGDRCPRDADQPRHLLDDPPNCGRTAGGYTAPGRPPETPQRNLRRRPLPQRCGTPGIGCAGERRDAAAVSACRASHGMGVSGTRSQRPDGRRPDPAQSGRSAASIPVRAGSCRTGAGHSGICPVLHRSARSIRTLRAGPAAGWNHNQAMERSRHEFVDRKCHVRNR